MKILSILLVAFFPSVAFGEQASCDGCGAYNCIEDQKQCGADGYPIAYGLKYCKRFFEPEVYNRYNDGGKEFIKCTRDCLIRKLQDYVKDSPEKDCDELADYAFESHVDCYTSCGFCRIWMSNKVALFKTYDLRDFLSKRALDQAKAIDDQCYSGQTPTESTASCGSLLEIVMMRDREKRDECLRARTQSVLDEDMPTLS